MKNGDAPVFVPNVLRIEKKDDEIQAFFLFRRGVKCSLVAKKNWNRYASP